MTQAVMGLTNLSTWKQPTPLGFGIHRVRLERSISGPFQNVSTFHFRQWIPTHIEVLGGEETAETRRFRCSSTSDQSNESILFKIDREFRGRNQRIPRYIPYLYLLIVPEGTETVSVKLYPSQPATAGRQTIEFFVFLGRRSSTRRIAGFWQIQPYVYLNWIGFIRSPNRQTTNNKKRSKTANQEQKAGHKTHRHHGALTYVCLNCLILVITDRRCKMGNVRI